MEFKEFLKLSPTYNNLVILEEYGEIDKIERVVVQHGIKTKRRVLIFNKNNKFISKHSIYISKRGYTILYKNRKLKY